MPPEEKRSNEVANERSEVRTPAFWRVVSSRGGRTIYLTSRMDPWSYKQHEAIGYDTEHEAKAAVACLGMHVRIRPVMHRVVKKPKSHGIGWAVARLKEGKRVRRREWSSADYFDRDAGEDLGLPDLCARDWELAE